MKAPLTTTVRTPTPIPFTGNIPPAPLQYTHTCDGRGRGHVLQVFLQSDTVNGVDGWDW